jgi:hypothetical protein
MTRRGHGFDSAARSRGITTEMSRPPAGWLRAVTVARCAVTTDRAMERPSPAPSRPFGPGRHAPERLEQRGDGVVRDERTAVGDLEVHGRDAAAGARPDPAAGLVVPDGAVDQVPDHPPKQLRVPGRLGRVKQLVALAYLREPGAVAPHGLGGDRGTERSEVAK